MKKEYGKKVSVIVPVYNVEKYLRQCLDSLVKQIYSNLEIILVNDGSTDMSGAICEQYAEMDERIIVVQKKNQGVSAARNEGIARASGEYLIFVDSDDCVHEMLVELYMQCADPQKVILCHLSTDESVLERKISVQESRGMDEYRRDSFMDFFYEDFVNSPVNKLYRTETIHQNKIFFPEGKDLGEDLLFNLEYFRYAPDKYCVIHQPLYYYRDDREGSLTNSYRKDLFEIQQELFGAVKAFLEDMGSWNEENQKIYYGMYWDRLYLTVQIYRAYQKKNPDEQNLLGVLEEPVWSDVWNECRKRKLLNWKRRTKALLLKGYRLLA